MNPKQLILRAFYSVCRCLPVKKKTVLLFSYYGGQYGGSPKYICEYLSKHSDFKVIWAFTDPSVHHGCSADKTVRYGRFGYYYRLATSEILITNYRMTEEFRKRKGQRYLQTWHSSLRMKMIEKDAENTLPENYLRMAKIDSPQIDWLLAGSEISRKIFERAFWYTGVIATTGTPQCDVLFNTPEGIGEKVRRCLGIGQEKKILLYAPTFRKNDDLSVYLSGTEELLEAVTARFGGEWVLLVRLHPHLLREADSLSFGERVINATAYDDAQELLAVSDVLLSDYSAIVFDFALTHRPCFLYTPDIDRYTSGDRGLYFRPEELPFISAGTPEELFLAIRDFDADKYEEDITGFLKRIGSFEDGHACERVLKLVERGIRK